MLKIIKYILFCLFAAVSLTISAFADVVTLPQTDGFADYVYIAGSSDEFPFEYYDDETESYSGIIPDMLERIAAKTGIDFVYINGDEKTRYRCLTIFRLKRFPL